MANIELVIKIPEEVYKASKMNSTLCMLDAIAKNYLIKGLINGTPLPKGHGRLIDEREVYKKFYCRCLAGVAKEVLDETPTIIEADES